MIYKHGDFGISVSQVDGFGKRPSLWVHDKNCMIKVASFGSEEKAKLFLDHLNWLVMINAEPPHQCFTVIQCKECGEYFEADRKHICKKENSYPVESEREDD